MKIDVVGFGALNIDKLFQLIELHMKMKNHI